MMSRLAILKAYGTNNIIGGVFRNPQMAKEYADALERNERGRLLRWEQTQLGDYLGQYYDGVIIYRVEYIPYDPSLPGMIWPVEDNE